MHLTLLTKNCLFRLVFLMLILGTTFSLYSQERSLRITNTQKGVTTIIKNKERVKLRTLSGEKLVGNLQIVDNENIWVSGRTIPLKDIYKLKKQPWILSAVTTGGLIYGGAVLVGVGAIVAMFGGPQPLLWLGAGGALVFIGAKKPSFGKIDPNKNQLVFEVIEN